MTTGLQAVSYLWNRIRRFLPCVCILAVLYCIIYAFTQGSFRSNRKILDLSVTSQEAVEDPGDNQAQESVKVKTAAPELFIDQVHEEEAIATASLGSSFENDQNWSTSTTQELVTTLTTESIEERDDLYNETTAFILHTDTCKIPRIKSFDPSVKFFLQPAEDITCGNKPPLLLTTGQKLQINQKALPDHNVHNVTLLNCCYKKIFRVQEDPNNYTTVADNHYGLAQDCTPFKDETNIKDTYILAQCTYDGNEIYKNVYTFIGSFATKLAEQKNISSVRDDYSLPHLSILLVGIDSVSKLNRMRKLNRVAHFLLSKGAIDLNGYIKIGDNTFPNLMAILTGLNETSLNKLCWGNADKKLDDCPFLWKDFSAKGYVTGYSEDVGEGGNFNSQKTGFVVQPVDFYTRPSMNAMLNELPNKINLNNYKVCFADKLAVNVTLSHAKMFANSFQNAPYFGLFWTESLSHDDINTVSLADKPYLQLFEELFYNPETLNHTILIFFSNHGLRYGDIRGTYSGWLEERMPFFMIWLPDWFKSQHPNAIANLNDNVGRLTSPFDVHYTLRDILNNNFDEPGSDSQIGQSLFQPVPMNRTCADAGISPHWCTCQESRNIDNYDSRAEESIHYLIEQLNIYVAPYKQCSILEIKEVVSTRVFRSQISSSAEIDTNRAISDFVIAFRTTPGEAMYEGTIRFAPDTNSYSMLGPISRIDPYGNTSHCMNDSELKKYCYCINQS